VVAIAISIPAGISLDQPEDVAGRGPHGYADVNTVFFFSWIISADIPVLLKMNVDGYPISIDNIFMDIVTYLETILSVE
jgi:hypothetical protein